MSHGCTEDARGINDANPAATENPDLSLTVHTNRHEDRRPLDTGEIDGHHIYSAPAKDADEYKERQSSLCPTLKSHTQVPRDKVITNSNTGRQLRRVATATKEEKKALPPTDRVTRSTGRARVNIIELIHTALESTTTINDPRT